jgi:hypothetical protein
MVHKQWISIQASCYRNTGLSRSRSLAGDKGGDGAGGGANVGGRELHAEVTNAAEVF